MMIKVDSADIWVNLDAASEVVVDQVSGSWVLKVSGRTIRAYASQALAVTDAERVVDVLGLFEL